ncbi:hypothetical protein LCGC14_2299620 [marine sediment metagenome]|uniref:Uncharacterized protein n=1 Tax=marine sediment metagenome TaxID=412755 RepID=A0A0F9DBD7_9ZZZZ
METILTPNLLAGEQVLDMGAGGKSAFVSRTTDPVILPQPYASPADFSAQYPTPLDPLEVISMCEEVGLWQYIPEEMTSLQEYTWRELNSLAFTSGSAYIAFADGECPEEYTHDGNNTSISLKNLGAKKSLSISDIMHSRAVSASNWHGINTLLGGFPSSEGAPGGTDAATFEMERVAGVKEKEVRIAMTLVLNGWDRLLALGDTNTNSLEFDGFEKWATNQSCSFHTNGTGTVSGTFSATTFDRFLSESCAKPTSLLGHPAAIQELMAGYFQLGYQGSQVVNFADGDRIVPGFNFGGYVNTGVGRLEVVADNNFSRVDVTGGAFSASIWAMRMNHNGEPLVYKLTQIPLAMKDLVPGCTAISFEIWTKTSLIIKHCCAHGVYTSQFTGRIVTTCPVIG